MAKTKSKSAQREAAASCFLVNPDVDELIVLEDGNCFFTADQSERAAKAHAGLHGLKMSKMTRSDVATEIKALEQPNQPKILDRTQEEWADLTVKEVGNIVEGVDSTEELQALLDSEWLPWKGANEHVSERIETLNGN